MAYAGGIIKKEGEHVVTPMRNFCRSEGKPAFYYWKRYV
jgi:hypothetical protein